MFLQRLRQWLGLPATNTPNRPAPRRRARLMVEPLEDRAVPASFTAATVPELIADINAANLSAEADTITLAPGKTFTLTAVNNTNIGATGLPTIAASGGGLTIIGNGDTIARSTGKGTPAFRLFDVQAGASLTLQDLTLQGGSASVGGAVYNLGTLTMIGVTVQKNIAWFGGGIYSNGSLFLQDCVIQNNQAVGADGQDGFKIGGEPFVSFIPPTPGYWGLGGGVYVAGGTAQLLGTTVTHNTAKGGEGGRGSGKYGVSNAPGGTGMGGGIYIESDAAVVLDAFTLAHVVDNTADIDPDIHGTYTLV